MSYRQDASGEYLTRTAATLPTWGTFTICGWFRQRAAGGTYPTILCVNGSAYSFLGFNTDVSATTIGVWGGGAFSANIITVANDVWFFAAMVHESTTLLRGYAAEVGVTSLTGKTQTCAMSAVTTTGIRILEDGSNLDWLNGNCFGLKAWNARLTQTELEAELTQTNPVRTANLFNQVLCSTATDINDTSGNGNHYSTAGGTPTTETDPSVPPTAGGGAARAQIPRTRPFPYKPGSPRGLR